jgi:hypothetical protein
MKVFMITDTHFGIYLNNMEKWLNMMESTFYEFLIPYIKENSKPGDILIHLGDLFDNRTNIPILVLNKVEKILIELSSIIPVHIMVGNHDLWNKGSNEVNSVRLFSYIPNITVYESTKILELGGRRLVIMPWIERKSDMIKEIGENFGDYLFCHSDLNGCKMHLTSVSHRNNDKIDVFNFKSYKKVFSGHIHIRQVNENFQFIGSLYQMDRNDFGDKKGITILDLSNDSIDFIPNTFSPEFKKVFIKTDEDLLILESLLNSKDLIDVIISNSLIMGSRKTRRKLESILELGKFNSIEWLDDLDKTTESEKDSIISDILNDDKSINENFDISIKLDYEDYIKKWIERQNFDNENIKFGILEEFDNIINIYNESYKDKSL